MNPNPLIPDFIRAIQELLKVYYDTRDVAYFARAISMLSTLLKEFEEK